MSPFQATLPDLDHTGIYILPNGTFFFHRIIFIIFRAIFFNAYTIRTSELAFRGRIEKNTDPDPTQEYKKMSTLHYYYDSFASVLVLQ